MIFYCARALFLSAQAWHLRISLKTRSARACAVQTHFRPSPFRMFFTPFSFKFTGLLRLGPALLRLSHAWPFSARNAIRSRLCSPNTLLSFPILLFSRKCFVLLRPSPAFLLPSPASPDFARNAIRSRLRVQTHFRPLLCGVLLKSFFAKCDGLLRLGPALLRLRRTLPISARKALRSRVCNQHTFGYSFCKRLLSKCAALLRKGSALLQLSMLCRAQSLLCLARALLCVPRGLFCCAKALFCWAQSLLCCAQALLCLARPCFALPRPCFDTSRLCFCSPRTTC